MFDTYRRKLCSSSSHLLTSTSLQKSGRLESLDDSCIPVAHRESPICTQTPAPGPIVLADTVTEASSAMAVTRTPSESSKLRVPSRHYGALLGMLR